MLDVWSLRPCFNKGIYMITVILIFTLVLLLQQDTLAQKFLQVEKNHLSSKLKFATGDEITFSLKNSDQWIRTAITEIDVENRALHTYGLTVFIDSIDAVRSYKPFISPLIGEILWKSGLAAFASSALFGLVYKADNTLDFLIVTGSIALTGLGLKQMSKIRRIYPIRDKYSIRAIDLNIYIQQPGKS